MKNLFLSIIIGLVFFMPTQIYAQMDLQNAVPYIKASINGIDEVGSGIIVGLNTGSENTIFILTARHVVFDPDDNLAGSIDVTFFQNKVEAYKARFRYEDPNLDLAVISVTISSSDLNNIPLYELPKASGDNKIKLKDDVILVGHPQDSKWEINRLNSIQKTPKEYQEFGKFAITPITISSGNSGGPVVDPKGNLLGMITNLSRIDAGCTTIDALINRLDGWGVPTNLLVKSRSTFKIDPHIIGGLGAASIAVGFVCYESALDKYDYYEDHILSPSADYPTPSGKFNQSYTRDNLYKAAVREKNIAIATAAGGGALILGGIVWHLIAKNNRNKPVNFNLEKYSVSMKPLVNPTSLFAKRQPTQFGIAIGF